MNKKLHSRHSDVFVSLVTVIDGASKNAEDLVLAAHAVLSESFSNYELLLVDNGASPAEFDSLERLLVSLPAVRLVRLSKSYALDDAAFAGLNSAIGDFVLFFNLEHDSSETLHTALLLLIEKNIDVLQGVSERELPGNLMNRFGRRFFYWYNAHFLGINIDPQATYLVGMSRRALNNATSLKRSQKYLRHIAQHLGYPVQKLRYEPKKLSSRSHSIRSGYSGAIEMISSYSIHPLRVVTFLGATAALLNLIYAVYVISISAFREDVVEGWTTTSLQMSFMFFVVCLILIIQSEYIGRILTETRGDRPYLIMEELESQSLIPHSERRNISE